MLFALSFNIRFLQASAFRQCLFARGTISVAMHANAEFSASVSCEGTTAVAKRLSQNNFVRFRMVSDNGSMAQFQESKNLVSIKVKPSAMRLYLQGLLQRPQVS